MLKRLFLRCYAAMYDLLNEPTERAGLRQQRHDLLAQAAGATIEIGRARTEPAALPAGRHPAGADRTRPAHGPPAARRAARLGLDAQIIDATSDQLPFPDASFDTAVITFALCSPDEQAALREITRVLAPGGRLLFLEHVRSADPRIAARQDKRPFPYPLIGCHPNRDTLQEIKASPLTLESVRSSEVAKAPKIERPMIVGAARRPGPA